MTRGLWATYAGLLGLLALTAGASTLRLGGAEAVVAYGVAIAKGGLIAWVFMELRQSPPLARLAAGIGFFWLGILFVLSLSDFLTRGWVGFSVPLGP